RPCRPPAGRHHPASRWRRRLPAVHPAARTASPRGAGAYRIPSRLDRPRSGGHAHRTHMTPPQERRRTAVSADLRHRPQGHEHRTTQRNPAHRRAPGASRASERPARLDREERVTVPAEPIEPTAPVLRVAVTAPYPALRAGLRSLLLDVPGVEIVREANDPGALADGPPIDLLVADLGDEPDVALEALEAALPAQPAVLLADWTGELDGVQLQSAPRALLRRTAS